MTTYTVQRADQAYAVAVPERAWETVHVTDSARGAALRLLKLRRWYVHDQGRGWSGHARIVGDDGLVYDLSQERLDENRMPARYRSRPLAELPWLENDGLPPIAEYVGLMSQAERKGARC